MSGYLCHCMRCPLPGPLSCACTFGSRSPTPIGDGPPSNANNPVVTGLAPGTQSAVAALGCTGSARLGEAAHPRRTITIPKKNRVGYEGVVSGDSSRFPGIIIRGGGVRTALTLMKLPA
jgi:hypothetical protein